MAYRNIDEFIKTYPQDVQVLLEKMRQAIKQAVPQAEEAISYNIPTFKLKGKNLVHFAAGKDHIGFYAIPDTNEAFKKELSRYKVGKGSVQFPFDQTLPLELIQKMVRFRVKELSAEK